MTGHCSQATATLHRAAPRCGGGGNSGWRLAALAMLLGCGLWSMAGAQESESSLAPPPDYSPATVDSAAPPEKDLADELTEGRVGNFIRRFTYLAIIGVLLLCGMGLPLPEEVPILASGVLARTGHLEPWPALFALMFGVLAGDSVMFLLGRRWGSHLFEHRFTRRMLTPERKVKIEAAFQKYGAWIVFVARFLPGIRAPLFLTAGSLKTSFWVFLAMDGAAALLSVPLSFWVAYYFTDKLQEMLELSHQVVFAILGVLLLLVIAAHYFWERRREEKILVRGSELLDKKVADLGEHATAPETPANESPPSLDV